MLAHSAPKPAAKPEPVIYYPYTDHQPIPDGTYQSPIYRKVVTTLENHFSKIPGARVNGNVFLYYEEGNPRHPHPLNRLAHTHPKVFATFP